MLNNPVYLKLRCQIKLRTTRLCLFFLLSACWVTLCYLSWLKKLLGVMRLRQLVSRQWVIFSINLLFPSVKKLPWPIPIIPNFSDFSCGPQSSCRPTTSVRWEMSVWFLMKFPSINKWLFRIDIYNTNRNYGLPSLYWKKYFPKKVLK